jgi:hypothetical protein
MRGRREEVRSLGKKGYIDVSMNKLANQRLTKNT